MAQGLGVSEHAATAYLPEPRERRTGRALCLSGGGFRASLFHLGALRRLNELGILSGLDTITSVSGGSIIAAHLATHLRPWPDAGTVASDWEIRVAAPFRSFAAKNIRTGPIFTRLLPWNWFRTSTGVRALAEQYRKKLTDLTLSDLPEHPDFVFCATDMAFGVNWVFERTRAGDYRAGYTRGVCRWPLARAVAASSCFPPVFNPLPIDVSPDDLYGGDVRRSAARDACIRGLRLTDGGNYDNLGLEPVWKSHAAVLVSDGGAVLDFEADKHLFWRLSRYTELQGNQALALRKRWLITSFAQQEYEGAYWGVGSLVENYQLTPEVSYHANLVKEVLSKVRTDLDAFSDGEAKVLENHGYILAEVAVQRHAAGLVQVLTPFAVPHRDWMDEDRVRSALKDSHRRQLPAGRW